MDKGIIKSAFFGYSKTSVCEYIASKNEEFSRQLIELEKEHKKEKDELKDKIEAAEKELAEYKKAHGENECLVAENQRLHKEQSDRLALYVAAVDRIRSDLSIFIADTDKRLAEYCRQAENIEREFHEL